MTGDKIAFEQQSEEAGGASRARSTIEFAYLDLKDAEEVVQAVHTNAGTSCTVDQLAGYMGQAARGGGFRVRISTAKTFGLVDTPRGGVALTDLGKKIVDPNSERAARVVAFLNVPLYKALYERFKGNVLPPRAALTREIINTGVAQSQADRARQTLERSAEHAGFFAHGRDRLVLPATIIPAVGETKSTKDEKPKNKGGDDGGTLHPLIEGLFKSLPPPETIWSTEKRVKWLQAASHNFDLVYQAEDDNDTITVGIIRSSKMT